MIDEPDHVETVGDDAGMRKVLAYQGPGLTGSTRFLPPVVLSLPSGQGRGKDSAVWVHGASQSTRQRFLRSATEVPGENTGVAGFGCGDVAAVSRSNQRGRQRGLFRLRMQSARRCNFDVTACDGCLTQVRCRAQSGPDAAGQDAATAHLSRVQQRAWRRCWLHDIYRFARPTWFDV